MLHQLRAKSKHIPQFMFVLNFKPHFEMLTTNLKDNMTQPPMNETPLP